MASRSRVPPGGEVLVLLHGFTHTGASWEPVRRALGRDGASLAPDLPGHGAAAEARPINLRAALARLAAELPARFTLVGYSMGGRIALQAALPENLGHRIDRLVLIGASPGLADPAERDARRTADEALAREMEAGDIGTFARRWANRAPVLEGQPPAVRERAHADRLRNSPSGLARALRGLGTGALPSLWERLGDLAMPVNLVVGERDRKFQAIAERMAARLPNARVQVLPGAGHAVHLEVPERVAELLVPAL